MRFMTRDRGTWQFAATKYRLKWWSSAIVQGLILTIYHEVIWCGQMWWHRWFVWSSHRVSVGLEKVKKLRESRELVFSTGWMARWRSAPVTQGTSVNVCELRSSISHSLWTRPESSQVHLPGETWIRKSWKKKKQNKTKKKKKQRASSSGFEILVIKWRKHLQFPVWFCGCNLCSSNNTSLFFFTIVIPPKYPPSVLLRSVESSNCYDPVAVVIDITLSEDKQVNVKLKSNQWLLCSKKYHDALRRE